MRSRACAATLPKARGKMICASSPLRAHSALTPIWQGLHGARLTPPRPLVNVGAAHGRAGLGMEREGCGLASPATASTVQAERPEKRFLGRGGSLSKGEGRSTRATPQQAAGQFPQQSRKIPRIVSRINAPSSLFPTGAPHPAPIPCCSSLAISASDPHRQEQKRAVGKGRG